MTIAKIFSVLPELVLAAILKNIKGVRGFHKMLRKLPNLGIQRIESMNFVTQRRIKSQNSISIRRGFAFG